MVPHLAFAGQHCPVDSLNIAVTKLYIIAYLLKLDCRQRADIVQACREDVSGREQGAVLERVPQQVCENDRGSGSCGWPFAAQRKERTKDRSRKK